MSLNPENHNPQLKILPPAQVSQEELDKMVVTYRNILPPRLQLILDKAMSGEKEIPWWKKAVAMLGFK